MSSYSAHSLSVISAGEITLDVDHGVRRICYNFFCQESQKKFCTLRSYAVHSLSVICAGGITLDIAHGVPPQILKEILFSKKSFVR